MRLAIDAGPSQRGEPKRNRNGREPLECQKAPNQPIRVLKVNTLALHK